MLRISTGRDTVLTHLTRPFATLVTEQVATKRATMLRLSGGCDLESPFHSLVCFLLGHGPSSTQIAVLSSVHVYISRPRRAGEYNAPNSAL